MTASTSVAATRPGGYAVAGVTRRLRALNTDELAIGAALAPGEPA
jgi:hypothetical protein